MNQVLQNHVIIRSITDKLAFIYPHVLLAFTNFPILILRRRTGLIF